VGPPRYPPPTPPVVLPVSVPLRCVRSFETGERPPPCLRVQGRANESVRAVPRGFAVAVPAPVVLVGRPRRVLVAKRDGHPEVWWGVRYGLFGRERLCGKPLAAAWVLQVGLRLCYRVANVRCVAVYALVRSVVRISKCPSDAGFRTPTPRSAKCRTHRRSATTTRCGFETAIPPAVVVG